MVVFFLLLVVIVQIAFLVASRSMISAAVDASARRLSHGSSVGEELTRLESEIAAVVPGVGHGGGAAAGLRRPSSTAAAAVPQTRIVTAHPMSNARRESIGVPCTPLSPLNAQLKAQTRNERGHMERSMRAPNAVA